jgi:hypothetical protein
MSGGGHVEVHAPQLVKPVASLLAELGMVAPATGAAAIA